MSLFLCSALFITTLKLLYLLLLVDQTVQIWKWHIWWRKHQDGKCLNIGCSLCLTNYVVLDKLISCWLSAMPMPTFRCFSDLTYLWFVVLFIRCQSAWWKCQNFHRYSLKRINCNFMKKVLLPQRLLRSLGGIKAVFQHHGVQ